MQKLCIVACLVSVMSCAAISAADQPDVRGSLVLEDRTARIQYFYAQADEISSTSTCNVVTVQKSVDGALEGDKDALAAVERLKKRESISVLFKHSDIAQSFTVVGVFPRAKQAWGTVLIEGLWKEVPRSVLMFVSGTQNSAPSVVPVLAGVCCVIGLRYAIERAGKRRLLRPPAAQPDEQSPVQRVDNSQEAVRADEVALHEQFEDANAFGLFLANPEWVRAAVAWCGAHEVLARSGYTVVRYHAGCEMALGRKNIICFALSDFFRDGTSPSAWCPNKIMQTLFMRDGQLKQELRFPQSIICIFVDQIASSEEEVKERILLEVCEQRIQALGGRVVSVVIQPGGLGHVSDAVVSRVSALDPNVSRVLAQCSTQPRPSRPHDREEYFGMRLLGRENVGTGAMEWDINQVRPSELERFEEVLDTYSDGSWRSIIFRIGHAIGVL